MTVGIYKRWVSWFFEELAWSSASYLNPRWPFWNSLVPLLSSTNLKPLRTHTMDEILSPLKSVIVLLLTSVEPEFHPVAHADLPRCQISFIPGNVTDSVFWTEASALNTFMFWGMIQPKLHPSSLSFKMQWGQVNGSWRALKELGWHRPEKKKISADSNEFLNQTVQASNSVLMFSLHVYLLEQCLHLAVPYFALKKKKKKSCYYCSVLMI